MMPGAMAAIPPVEDDVSQVASLRVPPHSIEAEQAVIGGLLLDSVAWEEIAGILTKQDFYIANHRLLFEAIEKLIENNRPCDVLTVAESLKDKIPGDESQFMLDLATLAKDTPSAANISAYARIVYKDSMRRKLLGVATKIIEDVYNPPVDDGENLIDFAEQQIFDLNEHGRKTVEFESLKDLSQLVYKQTEERSQHAGEIVGLGTGFPIIDEKTNGLQQGDLIIIAGRPSMGKTSLALNIVEHVALKEKKPVAIFSLEMPANQIVTRLFSSYGKINQGRIRTGQLNDSEWARMIEARRVFTDKQPQLYIDDSSVLTPLDVRSRVRRLKREIKGMSLVVIDYLQLMTVKENAENRAVEISKISRSLKALAKEVNVPVIALSQLNRNPETRQNQKPQLSDLRESGAIEQDADLVAMIYREGGSDSVAEGNKQADKVSVIDVVKHRNGPTFIGKLVFQGQFTKFREYVPDEILSEIPPSAMRSNPYVTEFDD